MTCPALTLSAAPQAHQHNVSEVKTAWFVVVTAQ
jgi:hypothetical protein